MLSSKFFGGQNRSLETTQSILMTYSPLGNANVSVLQHKHSKPPGRGTLMNTGFEYHGLFLSTFSYFRTTVFYASSKKATQVFIRLLKQNLYNSEANNKKMLNVKSPQTKTHSIPFWGNFQASRFSCLSVILWCVLNV